MAAPRHNYPCNSYISGAVPFNRNDPRCASIISNHGSDDADEDEVLSQVLQPAPHENQEPQGHAASTPQPDVTADSQDTLPASVESAVAPDDVAALEATEQTLTESLEEASTQQPTATRGSTPASTGEAAAEAGVAQETTPLQPVPSESQPEAGPSTAPATTTSPTGHTSPIVDTTSEASTSSHGQEGAATPDGLPHRSNRRANWRRTQVIHGLIAPASRVWRRASAAASGERPSTSAPRRHRSAPPLLGQATEPTFTLGTNSNSTQDETHAEAGPSTRPLGKRRRDEGHEREEDEDEDSESEDPSPSKKARRLKNLRNRSTPARFDTPKEEPKEEPSSPNPFLATPTRKRALEDDEENQPGPSKRARFDFDAEPLTPPRTPSPAPTLTSTPLLTAQPSEIWSVQAQPSLPMVLPPQEATGLQTPPTALNSPQPSFVALLGERPTQTEGPPALPPVPTQPGPLVRTYAKILEWNPPRRQ